MELVINTIAKRYAKKLLTHFESAGILTPALRKVILDAVNDMARDIVSKLNRV